MATAQNSGYRTGLVDATTGQISREIFVNEQIYAEEQKGFSRAPGSLSAMRARSRTPAITRRRGWARRRPSCAATGPAPYTYS